MFSSKKNKKQLLDAATRAARANLEELYENQDIIAAKKRKLTTLVSTVDALEQELNADFLHNGLINPAVDINGKPIKR